MSERAKPIPAQITVVKSLQGWGLRLRPLNTLVVVERRGLERMRKSEQVKKEEVKGGRVQVIS